MALVIPVTKAWCGVSNMLFCSPFSEEFAVRRNFGNDKMWQIRGQPGPLRSFQGVIAAPGLDCTTGQSKKQCLCILPRAQVCLSSFETVRSHFGHYTRLCISVHPWDMLLTATIQAQLLV